MHPALWISKTGLDAQQTGISVISNNLANVNTPAFKRGRASFEDLMYQVVQQPGAQSTADTQYASGLLLGTGVKINATEKIFSDGSVLQTKNPLDLAITGRGFFQIQMPDGTTSYSRNGQFQLDSAGRIVTAEGNPLQPAITIPPGSLSVTIGQDGIVSVLTPGNTTASAVGTIQLADFINPAGLQAMGGNHYNVTAASGAAQVGNPMVNGLGNINQGSLESSNVNVVEELVSLIEGQRAYEMNSKAIATVDSMLEFIDSVL
jgi:flagellar basal-body rod protein FlgG